MAKQARAPSKMGRDELEKRTARAAFRVFPAIAWGLPKLPGKVRELEDQASEVNKFRKDAEALFGRKKTLIEKAEKTAEEVETPLKEIGVDIKILKERGRDIGERKLEVTEEAKKLAAFIESGKVRYPKKNGKLIGFFEYVDERKKFLEGRFPKDVRKIYEQLEREVKSKIGKALGIEFKPKHYGVPKQGELF